MQLPIHQILCRRIPIEYIPALSHCIHHSFLLDSCITSALTPPIANPRQKLSYILVIYNLLF